MLDFGNYDKALEYFMQALYINLAIHGKDHRDTALSYNEIGTVFKYKGENDKAIEYHTKALKIKLATVGE